MRPPIGAEQPLPYDWEGRIPSVELSGEQSRHWLAAHEHRIKWCKDPIKPTVHSATELDAELRGAGPPARCPDTCNKAGGQLREPCQTCKPSSRSKCFWRFKVIEDRDRTTSYQGQGP